MTSIPNPGDARFGVSGLSAGAFDRDAACNQLNSLLRGEISAAETDAMAIQKCSQSDTSHVSDVQTLRDIQEEHGRTCQALRQRVRDLGGEASDSSGAWGAWAKTVEGTASLFGDK